MSFGIANQTDGRNSKIYQRAKKAELSDDLTQRFEEVEFQGGAQEYRVVH